MKMSGNTILITGGGSGIGLSMAKYFSALGNEIIICGRREDRLKDASDKLPGLHRVKCDLATTEGRRKLFQYMSDNYPEVNILINNAGIQRDIDLGGGIRELNRADNEIRINLEAPIFLSALFTPMLKGKDNAAIVNVSSGLAFMVEWAAGMPVYCATKAGMHAFSIAQRKQLKPLGIRVVEVIPPAVDTELNAEGRKKRKMMPASMISADDFVDQALAKLEADMDEIRWER